MKIQKTVKVVDKNQKLIGEFDYIDFLEFSIKLLEDNYTGGYYIINEYGGIDEINEFATCSNNQSNFSIVGELLHKLIKLQSNKILKRRKQ